MATLRVVLLLLVATFCDVAFAKGIQSHVSCYTRYGAQRVQYLPTHIRTTTSTIVLKSTKTSTPLATVTPPAYRKTVTVDTVLTRTVTAPARGKFTITRTYTTTSTKYTSTTTVTQLATSTSVVTSTSTSTVPTSPGFTAIADSPGFVPKVKARELNFPKSKREKTSLSVMVKQGSGLVYSTPRHPQLAECVEVVEPVSIKTVVVTARTHTTTRQPLTHTFTMLATCTSTSTIVPSNVRGCSTTTTTVTSCLRAVESTTVTSTTITTSTSVVPGPTEYAACKANNIISRANGNNTINSISCTGCLVEVAATDVTPYDCCVACQTSPQTCLNSFYSDSTNDQNVTSSLCQIYVAQQCTGEFPDSHCEPTDTCTDSSASFQTERNTSGSRDVFVLSNGPCLSVVDAGYTT